MSFRFALICTAALAAAAVSNAQARDFEMGGDGNYQIMAPEPGTGPHHVVGNKHARASKGRVKSLAEPDELKPNEPKHSLTARGSSGVVLPTPVPGPTHYAPIGSAAVVHSFPQEQGPTILPGSARPIPNLPHGAETFQDRASRCAFQSGINSVPGGQMSSYMHNCAM